MLVFCQDIDPNRAVPEALNLSASGIGMNATLAGVSGSQAGVVADD
jgi:hypothetical protein